MTIGEPRVPINIYLNQKLTDRERRARLFRGDIFFFSNVKACAAICDYAMESLKETFETPSPETAYHTLPVAEFVRRVATAKKRFTNSLRSKQLLRSYAEEVGTDPDDYYFDVPRIRIVPNYDYLHAGVSYAYAAHRDTWYGGPRYQINHWMPITAIEPDQTMAIYPAYFMRPVKNSSKDFNLAHWINVERARAVDNIEKEQRVHPLPLEDLEDGDELRFAGGPGEIMVFSGTHLHATVPNRTNVTRFSVDFRFFHAEDMRLNGYGSIRAPENHDCAAASGDYGLSSLFHLGDFSPFKK